MAGGDPDLPANLAVFPGGELAVVWGDGHESYFDPYRLRCACPCASCVDEMTGQKILRDELVPRDVRILEIEPVGRYALSIRWSDGHDTGIYIFQKMRASCTCEACAGRRG